jgi:hypothetical protein
MPIKRKYPRQPKNKGGQSSDVRTRKRNKKKKYNKDKDDKRQVMMDRREREEGKRELSTRWRQEGQQGKKKQNPEEGGIDKRQGI